MATVERCRGGAVEGEMTDHVRAHESAAPMRQSRSGPLLDVRVVDLTQAVAGPYCTMMLADMGADVVKVEPQSGDMPRWLPPFVEGDEDRHFGGYFASLNRNKRSIVIDLKTEDGRATLLDLVDSADVLVENYRTGVMDRLGLGYETLAERNPSLVYGAIRGFGDPRTGESPHSDWPAFDIVAQAMGGLMSYTGTVDGDRVACGPSIGDLYPATVLTSAVLGALHHSRRTGEGQFVDVAMVDSIMALSESLTFRYSYAGEVQAPRGAAHPTLCPFELYEAANGQIAIAAPGPEHWAALCREIAREDLIDDDRTRSTVRRVSNREFVRDAIEAWTRSRTVDEVVGMLGGRVPVGPVQDAPALFASAHVAARQMLVAVDHPGAARPVVTPNTPIRFARTPGGVYRRAPMLGEHGDEIRSELRRPPHDSRSEEHLHQQPRE